MKALITGINGQDASYLAELLLEKGYDVFGTVRRHSTPETQDTRIAHLGSEVTTFYADLTDHSSIKKILSEVKPDEVYNLAAQSHVRVSFDVPVYTAQVNAMGTLNVLEAVKEICPHGKLYQASSSEMFGNSIDSDGFQRETTRMEPVSPYGCAKLFGFSMVRHYRRAYGLFASNGILFNHESPRRGKNFVTNKVVYGAVDCYLGLIDKLQMGNLNSSRDWGHSKDYVRAMWQMLQHDKPDDFVISTGTTHSVRHLCEYAFSKLGMDWNDYIVIDEGLKRGEELNVLKGDSTKARKELNWSPEYTFESMIDEMIDEALNDRKSKDNPRKILSIL
jgi:GDPmannose 4,6-dehydratase